MSNIIFEDDTWNWKTDKIFNMVYDNNFYFLQDFFYNPETIKILHQISEEIFEKANNTNRKIYPAMEDCFRSLQIYKPKVIILGMDPYHNGAATGLCFSISSNSTQINPSFRSIQKEVESNGFKVNKSSGNITNWAAQGVYLLNTALTVEEADAGSHLENWAKFTENLLEYLTTKNDNLVIFLWGKDAQSFEVNVKNKEQHFILKSTHPMPLSAYKSIGGNPAFIGSKCFTKANDYLQKHNKDIINWDIL